MTYNDDRSRQGAQSPFVELMRFLGTDLVWNKALSGGARRARISGVDGPPKRGNGPGAG